MKRNNQLVIYLCETKEVHSKLYLIEYGPVDAGNDEEPTEGGLAQWTFDEEDDSDERVETTHSTNESGVDQTGDMPREATAIIGSPNLSKNAWSRQANTGVVIETTTESDLWADLGAFYEEHRDYNNTGPFLDDLTERLENAEDDRADVLTLYTEGKVQTRDEVAQLHGRLDEHIEAEVDAVDLVLGEDTGFSEGTKEVAAEHQPEREPDRESSASDGGKPSNDKQGKLDPTEGSETRINLSLVGHSEEAIETVSKMTEFDASLTGDSLTATPRAVQQYKRDLFEVPTMRITRSEIGNDERSMERFGEYLNFHADGQVYRVGQPLPEDSASVNEALQGIEDYFETVDKYGNCNDPDAVKAHMAEALLWMMWAPFANRAATFYRSYGIDLDKALPNLYIYGESDAGKGTFAEFALSLISGGRVQKPVDADEVGKREIRGMRSANTAFPIVVDDITKDTVNRLDTFRNYWGNWTPEASYPLFAFISNDKRPDEWFRNRAKILHFDVNFDTSYKGEAEVNRLIRQENPLFLWFTHEFLTRDLRLTDDDDALRGAREVLLDIYEYADRSVPEWFPRRPAEREHDAGRNRWFDLLRRDDVTTEGRGDTLRISFPQEMSTDTYTYARDPPTVARVERRGRDLLIKSPAEFAQWLGEPPAGVDLGEYGVQTEADSASNGESESTARAGLVGRIRGMFS